MIDDMIPPRVFYDSVEVALVKCVQSFKVFRGVNILTMFHCHTEVC